MNKSKVSAVINTVLKSGALKTIPRTGWVLKGVEEAESVADHTWRVLFLVVLLADGSLHKKKLFDMAVVHDLGEVGIGDIKWETGAKVIGDQVVKHQDEENAIQEIFGRYPKSEYYISLIKDFNEQTSPEAKFLKQVDKLEMAFQALEYEKAGYPAHLFDEFWENSEKYLKGQSLEPIFNELKNRRKEI